MLHRTIALSVPLLAFQAMVLGSNIQAAGSRPTPIDHVVIIFQENHSFDNVLGILCIQLGRCMGPPTAANGKPVGLLHDGSAITLPNAGDIVSPSPHSHDAQVTAVNGGAMNGFDLMVEGGRDCDRPYVCYEAFDPNKIPNLATLATEFVIADHTFQSDPAASWGGHLSLVAGTSDGFYGNNPCQNVPGQPAGCLNRTMGPGWGCDSNRDALWTAPDAANPAFVPACVPFPNGTGTYLDASGKTSPVRWVPTIMDRLDRARLSWTMYAGTGAEPGSAAYQNSGYQWATCPSFADCLETGQRNNLALASQVIPDARNGKLPAFSIVTPTTANSQHNFESMKLGDNWIGQVVQAIESGPDWSTTAIFITYDDCGCFYDHVTPPSPALGIRVPMVVVSPFARRGFTDANVASYASLLAFTEYVFGLQPLADADANAYDFRNSFDFGQPRLGAVPMVTSLVGADELAYIAAHPPRDDDGT